MFYVGHQRRESERLRVQVPVTVAWTQQNIRRRHVGITRDLSTHGVFVWADVVPPADTAVSIEFRIPVAHDEGAQLQVRAVGEVIRSDAMAGSQPGFVIRSVKRFHLRRAVGDRAIAFPAS